MSQSNVFYADILSLGVTQLYLSSRKVDAVLQWFHPANMDTYAPLPVYDFGDGLRLTDGHSRAYVAYRMGLQSIPVILDRSELVTGELGQKLYRADVEWAKRYGIRNVSDLSGRVVTDAEYNRLWKRRCDRSYDLLTRPQESALRLLQYEDRDVFLYGSDHSASIFYYEDASGGLYVLKDGNLQPE